MIKKIIFYFLICMLTISPSGAQPVVEWGESIDMEDDDEEVVTYNLPDGGYYTLQLKDLRGIIKVKIRLFNSSGKIVKTHKYKIPGQISLSFVELGGTRYLLTQEAKLSKPWSQYLNAWYFDPYEEKKKLEPISLGSVPIFPAGGQMPYEVNADHTKLFVLEIPGQKKGIKEKWTLKAYDSQLKHLYTKSFGLDYDEDLFFLKHLKVDHNDNLVMTCYLFDERPKLFAKLPPFKLIVYTIPSGTDQLKEISLSMPGVIPHQINYLEHNDNTFTCYGLYGKSKLGFSSGVFTAKFNVNGQVIRPPQLREFPSNIMELAARRGSNRKEEEVFGFTMGGVRMREDGGMQIIAEQKDNRFQTISYSSTSDGITYTSSVSGTQYQHDDIMVFSLYDDAKKDWFSLLRKRQSSFGEKNYLSYTYSYNSNGQLYILYNDLAENLTLSNDKEPENLKAGREKMVTVLASFDKQGNLTRSILFSKKDIGHSFVPLLTKRQQNYLLLTTTSRKSFRIGKLELK